jgi:hypothetical protein
MNKEAFESFGGRKFFGLVVLDLLMTVVAVFAKSLTVELSGGLVALYVAFVGGNSFTTAKALGQQDEYVEARVEAATQETQQQQQQDLTPIINEINSINERVNQAATTAQQAGEATLQIANQLQALKNLTAAALKNK